MKAPPKGAHKRTHSLSSGAQAHHLAAPNAPGVGGGQTKLEPITSSLSGRVGGATPGEPPRTAGPEVGTFSLRESGITEVPEKEGSTPTPTNSAAAAPSVSVSSPQPLSPVRDAQRGYGPGREGISPPASPGPFSAGAGGLVRRFGSLFVSSSSGGGHHGEKERSPRGSSAEERGETSAAEKKGDASGASQAQEIEKPGKAVFGRAFFSFSILLHRG